MPASRDTDLSITSLVQLRMEGRCPRPGFSNIVRRKRRRKALLPSPQIQSPDSAVYSMDIHPVDCRYLLTGCGEGEISVYDLSAWGASRAPGQPTGIKTHSPVARSLRAPPTRNPSLIPTGHSMAVESVRWYPADSGAFVSAARDGTILVWDTNEMVPVANLEPFRGDKYILQPDALATANCMEISEKATNMTAVGSKLIDSVKLCDIRTGTYSHSLTGHRAGILSIKWSPVSEYTLVSGSADGCIRIWDIRKPGSNGCVAVLDQDARPDLSVSKGYLEGYGHLTSRDKSEVTGPNNYRRTQRKSVVSAEGGVTGLAFTSDGHRLVSASSNGELNIWDLTSSTGHLLPRQFRGPGGGPPVQKSKKWIDRQLPLLVSDDSIWVSHGTRLYEYPVTEGQKPRQILQGHLRNIESVAMVSDTGDIYTSAGDGLILAWGLPSNRQRKRALDDHDSW